MTINVNGSRCYWTVLSTASKKLNLNNPILSDQRERSVGGMKHPLDQRLEETPHIDKKSPSIVCLHQDTCYFKYYSYLCNV